MANSLSITSVLEKNRIESGVPFLILLDITVVDPDTGEQMEVIRLVRNNEDVTHAGEVYTGAMFDVSFDQATGEQTSLELSIQDHTQAIQARMQAYNGGVGFLVTMSIVDGSALDLPAELQEHFEVVTASAAEYTATWRLGVSSALTVQFPRRRQTKDFCAWRFKDPETCGYVGSHSKCDLTLQGPDGCAAKGNRLDGRPQVMFFGAYPGINSSGVRYA